MPRHLLMVIILVLGDTPVWADYDVPVAQAKALDDGCNEKIVRRVGGMMVPTKPTASGGTCQELWDVCMRSDLLLQGNIHKMCMVRMHGQPRGGGVAIAFIGLRGVEDDTSAMVATVAVDVRWLFQSVSRRWIPGRALQLALEVGGGLDGGFVWEARGSAGIGSTIGRTSAVAITVGIGGSGWTGGRVPAALTIPVQMYATTNLGTRVKAVLWMSHEFVAFSEARQNGADHGLFGDELTAGIVLSVSRNRWVAGNVTGAGFFGGLTYREQLGGNAGGLVFGYGYAGHSGL